MRKNRKKKKVESMSMIGRIIDLPVDEFIKQIKEQKLSVGILQNINLNLQCTYSELQVRKDALIKSVCEGNLKKEDPEVKRVLEGCYSEMMKIEDKVLNLKEIIKELSDVG